MTSALISLCVALGIGLLIGAERERRKGSGPTRSAAGIRTFTVVSLLGAISMLAGGEILLAITELVVGVLAVVAYQRTRNEDPGMTTEVALLLTCITGGLTVRDPSLAAGVGIVLAVLLAARNRMHYFVQGVLTQSELNDALLFFAIALVVWPLAPDKFIGPFNALNPHAIVHLVLLVMTISSLGYVAKRLLGARYGLPLAGFAGGFISSTATIYSMGKQARKQPTQMHHMISGALLSSIATIIQMAVVIASLQPSLLNILLQPLVFACVAACAYSFVFAKTGISTTNTLENGTPDRAFSLKTSIGFAAIVSAIFVLSAALNFWLGPQGTLLAGAITGLVDPHATAASMASLVTADKISLRSATWPILVGLSANSVTKAVVAFHSGGGPYARRIIPGLVLIILAMWIGALLG